jgi:hypothetical protein
MQLIRTLSIGFLATMLWNCNSSTQPDTASMPDPKISQTVNALTKIAAVQAGYVPLGQSRVTQDEMPFDVRALAELKNAGLCQGFIDLFQEIATNQQSMATGVIPPRLQQVVTCFSQKADLFTDSTAFATNFLSIVEDCFCNGTGSIFADFNFTLGKYGPPTQGVQYGAPAITAVPYSAPTVTGSSYSAPNSTAETYSAPDL